jgi:hypothetical protein
VIKEMLDKNPEQDIVDIAIGGAREERPRNVGKRVFGFSNWNGSKWEPTGPKTNPNLN